MVLSSALLSSTEHGRRTIRAALSDRSEQLVGIHAGLWSLFAWTGVSVPVCARAPSRSFVGSDSGRLFAWGFGDSGRLGLGNERNVLGNVMEEVCDACPCRSPSRSWHQTPRSCLAVVAELCKSVLAQATQLSSPTVRHNCCTLTPIPQPVGT
jgi:hypothetical protein